MSSSGSVLKSRFVGATPAVSGVDGVGTYARFGLNNLQTSYCKYDGYFYVADGSSSTIRRMDTLANVVTVAGHDISFGNGGYANGVGTNAIFNQIYGVDCNSNTGDLVAVDSFNNVLRFISWPSRTVSLFVGRPGVPGFVDGVGTNALIGGSFSNIAFRSADNCFYLADFGNNAVRQITMQAQVTTLAGSPAGTSGFQDTIGTLALFSGPWGIRCDDNSGNIFVGANSRLRMIDMSTKNVYTVAGSGVYGTVAGVGTYAQVISFS